MESFKLEFTVKEWRIMAAALAQAKMNVAEHRLMARQLAHTIAGYTGYYDAEGKRRNER
jgi:hypothetical protein